MTREYSSSWKYFLHLISETPQSLDFILLSLVASSLNPSLLCLQPLNIGTPPHSFFGSLYLVLDGLCHVVTDFLISIYNPQLSSQIWTAISSCVVDISAWLSINFLTLTTSQIKSTFLSKITCTHSLPYHFCCSNPLGPESWLHPKHLSSK